VPHRDDGGADGAVFGVGFELGDEGAVDFEGVDGKTLE
jgi:hypothetical protein